MMLEVYNDAILGTVYLDCCTWRFIRMDRSSFSSFPLFVSSDLFVYYVGDYRQGPSVCMLCIDPEEPLHSKSDIITAVMMQYYFFSSITILYSVLWM